MISYEITGVIEYADSDCCITIKVFMEAGIIFSSIKLTPEVYLGPRIASVNPSPNKYPEKATPGRENFD